MTDNKPKRSDYQKQLKANIADYVRNASTEQMRRAP